MLECRYRNGMECRLRSSFMGMVNRVDGTFCLYNCGETDDQKISMVKKFFDVPIEQLPDLSDPGWLEKKGIQVKNLTGSLIKREAARLAGQQVDRTPEQGEILHNICRACPSGRYDAKLDECNDCHCRMRRKTCWATERCQRGHFDSKLREFGETWWFKKAAKKTKQTEVWFQTKPDGRSFNFQKMIKGMRQAGIQVEEIDFYRSYRGDPNHSYLQELRDNIPSSLKVIIGLGYEGTKYLQEIFKGTGVSVCFADNGWLPISKYCTIDPQGLLAEHSMVGNLLETTEPMLAELQKVRQYYQEKAERATPLDLSRPYIFVPMRPYFAGDFDVFAGGRLLRWMDENGGRCHRTAVQSVLELTSRAFPDLPIIYKERATAKKDEVEKQEKVLEYYKPYLKEGDQVLFTGDPYWLMKNARAVVGIHTNCLSEALLYDVASCGLGYGLYKGLDVVLNRAEEGDVRDVLTYVPDPQQVEQYLANMAWWQIERHTDKIEWDRPWWQWLWERVKG